MDLLAESGQLGGKLYGLEKLAKLQRYLERRGIYLAPARNGSFNGVKGIMTLPQNPTVLNVRHELSQMLDFRKYGKDYYKRFNSFGREEMVLDRLMDNQASGWKGWSAFADKNTRWAWESRAFAEEISIARRLGDQQLVDDLIRLRTIEWRRIFKPHLVE